MTVVSLLNHPTLSKPETVLKHIHTAVQDMDKHIDLLRLAADSADANSADQTLIDSLYFLQAKLRRECDKLFALM
jgi:hypothetical protein